MDSKICFVVMPFGKKPIAGTDATFDFDKVFRVVMQPAIRAAGFEPVRADESASSGLIHGDMFKELRDRPVVLVDLSLNNPNVAYELGARHVMAQRGTVLMCERSTALPFDIKLSRVVRYVYDGNSFDYEEAERVVPLITTALREAANQPDSPVHALLDRVLQDSTARLTIAMHDGVAYADTPDVLRRYAQIVAGTWDRATSVDALIEEGHAGSRIGALALYEFCKSQEPPPEGTDAVASDLRRYSEFAASVELFERLDENGGLEPWRYMQYGAAKGAANPGLDGARQSLELQKKGLDQAHSMFLEQPTIENRWSYAFCLEYVGRTNARIWRYGDREDRQALEDAIARFSESLAVVGDSPPPWLEFVLRSHLAHMYLLRARDGRKDRPDDEGHLAAILQLQPNPDARAGTRSTSGWYKVIAQVERGAEDESLRAAVKQLDRDAQLVKIEPSFNPSQGYIRLLWMMGDYEPERRHRALWGRIAQLLKDASTPSADSG